MREKKEIPEMVAELGNDSREVRITAVKELSARGEDAVRPLILAMKQNRSNDFRWYAALTLARIGNPAISPLIRAMKEESDPDFRRFSAAALGKIGEPAVDSLIIAMKDADPPLRGYFSAALCRIGTAALPRLKEACGSDDEEIRKCAELTLMGMGEEGIRAMIEPSDEEKCS